MGTRVLIADDASFMRQMIREIIEPEGFEIVAEAADGREVEGQFQAHVPELVLLDVAIPPGSAAEVVQALRACDPGARVVLASALGQESAVLEALEAGALDFVVKPFQPEYVLHTLRRALEK